MLEELLNRIYEKHPTQQKKIEKFFSKTPRAKSDLGHFLDMYSLFLGNEGITVEKLADSYSEMVDQMFFCRLHFLKTGQYPLQSQEDAFKQVYDNPSLMT